MRFRARAGRFQSRSTKIRAKGGRRRNPSLGVEQLDPRIVLAASYLVTGSGDAAGLPAAGGVGTETDPFRVASLRSAIQLANATPGLDTIRFSDVLYSETISIAARLVVTDPVSIFGFGEGDLTVRYATPPAVKQSVFYVNTPGNPSFSLISSLTISGGTASGIENAGGLTVYGCTISDNSSTLTGGGGILNRGTLSVAMSTIEFNTAADFSSGGGIANYGTLTVEDSTIRFNTATFGGGGVYNQSNNAVLRRCLISGNEATGINTFGQPSNNAQGGGIRSQGSMTLDTCTISGNVSRTYGGGIYVVTGTTTITQCTIFDNTAVGSGSAIYNASGWVDIGRSVLLRNLYPQVSGAIDADDYNVFGCKEDQWEFSFAGSTDIDAWDLNLPAASIIDPTLRDNGGPTQTHALPAGSIAIDVVAGSRDDQRGFPSVGKVDAGAYEWQPFTLQKEIGDVEFGTIPSGYALRDGSRMARVTYAGGQASNSKPGGGWKGKGVVSNWPRQGYSLLLRNDNGNLLVWELDRDGAQVSDREVSKQELWAIERREDVDIDDDGLVGSGTPAGSFLPLSSVADTEFGITSAGYALRLSSSIGFGSGFVLPITFGGTNVSDTAPGGGWIGLATRSVTGGYELLWRNSQTGGYLVWQITYGGAVSRSYAMSAGDFQSYETVVMQDLDGDGQIGNFRSRMELDLVSFGTTPSGYALLVDGESIPVTAGAVTASDTFPGGGWIGCAARYVSDGFQLLFRNTQHAGIFSWTLNEFGAATKGAEMPRADFNALETAADKDLDGDGQIGTFTSRQKLGGIRLGTTSEGYALLVDGVVMPVTLGGYNASAALPGDGWVGLAASYGERDYDLYWKNANTGEVVRWLLVETGGPSPRAEAVETRVVTPQQWSHVERDWRTDFDGDGKIGDLTPGQTLDGLNFGTASGNYALLSAGTVVPVTLGGSPVSDRNPGAGWKALGAMDTDDGFELLWKNASTGDSVAWTLAPTGAAIGSRPVTRNEFAALEAATGKDLDGDTMIRDFTLRQTIGGVNFGTTASGYALFVNRQIMPVTLGGTNVSDVKPGGWVAQAAREGGSGYELFWKNPQTGAFLAWTLTTLGAAAGSRPVSLPEFQQLETSASRDLDRDGLIGDFQVRQKVGDVSFGQRAAGYALLVGGRVLPVTVFGFNTSDSFPGSGWVGVGARRLGIGYEFLWKNTLRPEYLAWTLGSDGAAVTSRAVSQADIRALEAELGQDIDGDRVIGTPAVG